MSAPLEDNRSTASAARNRVLKAERRSLARRFDHACETAEAALDRMRAIVADLALLADDDLGRAP